MPIRIIIPIINTWHWPQHKQHVGWLILITIIFFKNSSASLTMCILQPFYSTSLVTTTIWECFIWNLTTTQLFHSTSFGIKQSILQHFFWSKTQIFLICNQTQPFAADTTILVYHFVVDTTILQPFTWQLPAIHGTAARGRPCKTSHTITSHHLLSPTCHSLVTKL